MRQSLKIHRDNILKIISFSYFVRENPVRISNLTGFLQFLETLDYNGVDVFSASGEAY